MALDGYIQSLVEDGASRAHGAWAEGHHDPTEFAEAVAKEYARIVPGWHVRRGYMRRVFGTLWMTEVPGPGATAATWVEW